jgi:hypothetical protein
MSEYLAKFPRLPLHVADQAAANAHFQTSNKVEHNMDGVVFGI